MLQRKPVPQPYGRRTPYIGITGFTSPEQTRAALQIMRGSPRKLMIGVLASKKSIAGLPVRQQKRYPHFNDIEPIFRFERQALNLLHYHTDEPDKLREDLDYLMAKMKFRLEGFQ